MDLHHMPDICYIEIDIRYIWRYSWKKELSVKDKFRWIISSGAHQPNWLNQNIASRVVKELRIEEIILLRKKPFCCECSLSQKR